MAKQTENNTRRHVKTVRLTDDELALLELLASESEMTLSEYMRTRILSGKIARPLMNKKDSQEINTLLFQSNKELNAIGKNINQIAHCLNILKSRLEKNEAYNSDISQTLHQVNQMFQQHAQLLNRAFKGISVVWKIIAKKGAD